MPGIESTVQASAVVVEGSAKRMKVIATMMMSVKAPWSVAATIAIRQGGIGVLTAVSLQVRRVKKLCNLYAMLALFT